MISSRFINAGSPPKAPQQRRENAGLGQTLTPKQVAEVTWPSIIAKVPPDFKRTSPAHPMTTNLRRGIYPNAFKDSNRPFGLFPFGIGVANP